MLFRSYTKTVLIFLYNCFLGNLNCYIVSKVVSNFDRLYGRAVRRFSTAPSRRPRDLCPERYHACQAVQAREADLAATLPLPRPGMRKAG